MPRRNPPEENIFSAEEPPEEEDGKDEGKIDEDSWEPDESNDNILEDIDSKHFPREQCILCDYKDEEYVDISPKFFTDIEDLIHTSFQNGSLNKGLREAITKYEQTIRSTSILRIQSNPKKYGSKQPFPELDIDTLTNHVIYHTNEIMSIRIRKYFELERLQTLVQRKELNRKITKKGKIIRGVNLKAVETIRGLIKQQCELFAENKTSTKKRTGTYLSKLGEKK